MSVVLHELTSPFCRLKRQCACCSLACWSQSPSECNLCTMHLGSSIPPWPAPHHLCDALLLLCGNVFQACHQHTIIFISHQGSNSGPNLHKSMSDNTPVITSKHTTLVYTSQSRNSLFFQCTQSTRVTHMICLHAPIPGYRVAHDASWP